jgi:hypothetical protein
MFWLSAEKQPPIFFEFFNRIGQFRTLGKHKKPRALTGLHSYSVLRLGCLSSLTKSNQANQCCAE